MDYVSHLSHMATPKDTLLCHLQMRRSGSESVQGDSISRSVTPGPVYMSYSQSWLFVVDVFIKCPDLESLVCSIILFSGNLHFQFLTIIDGYRIKVEVLLALKAEV